MPDPQDGPNGQLTGSGHTSILCVVLGVGNVFSSLWACFRFSYETNLFLLVSMWFQEVGSCDFEIFFRIPKSGRTWTPRATELPFANAQVIHIHTNLNTPTSKPQKQA